MYTFGVSGRLYKSNVLLYDHQTESLWSQLMEKAISGQMVGKRLEKRPSSRTKWKTWMKKYPETLVLSTDTGHKRDYARDPYEGYYRVGRIWFPVGEVREDLSPKERVLGIEINNEAKAYPLLSFNVNSGIIKDNLRGTTIHIEVSPEGEVTAVTDEFGGPIPHIFAYWFAWQAFHPNTMVYEKEW